MHEQGDGPVAERAHLATNPLRISHSRGDGDGVVHIAWEQGAVDVTPMEARDLADALCAAATLAREAQTRDMETRRREVEARRRAREATRRDRDELVRSLFAAGRSPAEVADVIGKPLRRVWGIMRELGVHPRKTCDVDGCNVTIRWRSTWCLTHRERAELYGDPLGAAPRPPEHGLHGYRTRRCRCDVYKAAGARERTRSRDRGRQDPSRIPHGTVSGYFRWACRCDGCKTAGTDYSRVMEARRKERARSAPGGETE